MIFYILYYLVLVCYLFSETSGNFKRRAVNKIILACLFEALALFNFFGKAFTYMDLLLLVAITFSFIGDILLLYSFSKGGVAFIIGNILYTVYLLLLYKTYNFYIYAWFIILVCCYSIYLHMLKVKYLNLGKMKAFSYYMFSICAHASLGILLVFTSPLIPHKILGSGLFLFMISDFFLASNRFHDKENKLVLRTNSFTYFSGMLLIAIYMGL